MGGDQSFLDYDESVQSAKPVINDQIVSFLTQWRARHLDQITQTIDTVSVKALDASAVLVSVVALMSTPSETGGNDPAIDIKTDYTFYGNGEVVVDCNVSFRKENAMYSLRTLPCVGVRFSAPAEFGELSFFGRGPHENYWDRKRSAMTGTWKSTVNDQFIPYIFPSENGGKADCQWVALTNAKGNGLLVASTASAAPSAAPRAYGPGAPIQMSALRFTVEELEAARHPFELPGYSDGHQSEKPVEVRLCNAMTGLGGDTSWEPKTMEKYTIKPREGPFNYSLRFFPLSGNVSPAKAACGNAN